MEAESIPVTTDYATLVNKYLTEGLKLKDVVKVIGRKHGMWRSLRTAQRHARSLGYGEDSVVSSEDLGLLVPMVEEELKNIGRGMGCDALWRIIQRKYGIKTRRQLIRDIVKALQPGRNEEMKHQRLRRRVYTVKGPNHMWHADGYDKLKPYGLCIHACIDGFSRRLIWLEVSRSNKNPALICNYFLSSVQDLSMVPRVVRLDHGTENVHVITCQRMLREVHEDSLVQVSVMLGSSNHNQRIERFWSYLRTSLIQDYMNIFKDYLSTGVIDFSKPTHVECVAFCFLPVLRSELKALFNTWNTSHEIRQMKNSGCPSGVPQTLFEHPQIHNAEEQGLLAEDEILRRCQEHYSVHNVVDVDPAFEAWALQVMIESNLALPHDIDQACKLFTKLICKIYESE